ncbi:MAG: hypothetical protein GY710_22270 [Desulfobacteraceae bacterium]|nr:hypothetical protein [Desulfobacteraceae bacterium]
MKNLDEQRRKLIKGGVIFGGGVLLGVPAFGVISNCRIGPTAGSDKKTHAVDLIRKEHIRLSGKQINEIAVGNTLIGVTYKGVPYVLHFDPNGEVILQMNDGRKEVGKWEINNDHIMSQWPTIANNERLELDYYQYKNGHIYLSVATQFPHKSSRWSWFVIEPGRNEQL